MGEHGDRDGHTQHAVAWIAFFVSIKNWCQRAIWYISLVRQLAALSFIFVIVRINGLLFMLRQKNWLRCIPHLVSRTHKTRRPNGPSSGLANYANFPSSDAILSGIKCHIRYPTADFPQNLLQSDTMNGWHRELWMKREGGERIFLTQSLSKCGVGDNINLCAPTVIEKIKWIIAFNIGDVDKTPHTHGSQFIRQSLCRALFS